MLVVILCSLFVVCGFVVGVGVVFMGGRVGVVMGMIVVVGLIVGVGLGVMGGVFGNVLGGVFGNVFGNVLGGGVVVVLFCMCWWIVCFILVGGVFFGKCIVLLVGSCMFGII